MKFDKFLGRTPEPAPKPRAKKTKDPAQLIPGTTRKQKKYIKRPSVSGARHWAVKRNVLKARRKRRYARTRLKEAAHRQTLRRKYIQHRSVARIRAKRRGEDPAYWYQMSYAEYLLIWEQAPDVYVPDRGIVKAKALQDSPVRVEGCTYMDRIDRAKPFMRENMAIFRNGRQLG